MVLYYFFVLYFWLSLSPWTIWCLFIHILQLCERMLIFVLDFVSYFPNESSYEFDMFEHGFTQHVWMKVIHKKKKLPHVNF